MFSLGTCLGHPGVERCGELTEGAREETPDLNMPSHFAVNSLGGKVGDVIDVWVLVHLIFYFLFLFFAVSSLGKEGRGRN